MNAPALLQMEQAAADMRRPLRQAWAQCSGLLWGASCGPGARIVGRRMSDQDNDLFRRETLVFFQHH
jgi:hypothetical protein